mmetsp:Transcript_34012/g.33168  ORF Transcript_34012/g.33168 Transcript_34012/m.33168 type:complete len:275 (-) Transcript_34012:837-1661(-)
MYDSSTQSASFEVYINQKPNPTAVGTAYEFGNTINTIYTQCDCWVDPLVVYREDDIFTRMFPWLKTAGETTFLEVDTSLWFDEPQGETMTYELTYSDALDRRSWMAFNIHTGVLRANVMQETPSEYMHIRVSATDSFEGSYAHYKTLLVDTRPYPQKLHTTIYCNVNQPCAYSFKDAFYDPNGDYLTYQAEDSLQYTVLRNLGLEYYSPTQVLAGTPTYVTYVNGLEITAMDPYGLTNSIVFNVIVRKTDPEVRAIGKNELPDQYITEGYLYWF